MKKCPYCAELIQDDAILCPHCRKDVRQTMVAAETLKKVGCALMQLPFLILGLVLAGITVWCLLSSLFAQ